MEIASHRLLDDVMPLNHLPEEIRRGFERALYVDLDELQPIGCHAEGSVNGISADAMGQFEAEADGMTEADWDHADLLRRIHHVDQRRAAC